MLVRVLEAVLLAAALLVAALVVDEFLTTPAPSDLSPSDLDSAWGANPTEQSTRVNWDCNDVMAEQGGNVCTQQTCYLGDCTEGNTCVYCATNAENFHALFRVHGTRVQPERGRLRAALERDLRARVLGWDCDASVTATSCPTASVMSEQ